MTLILGKSVATAKQMATYLLSVNKSPKFSRNISAEDFCQLFLDVCAKEGVRGDLAFCQSVKETGAFKYGGDVSYTQNNFAGIGATGGVPGCSFKDIETGILAQAQHLKTYATKSPLNEPCVDPRRTTWFVNAKGGTAQNWEELGGTWAVPGYSTSKYKSLAEANKAKDSYGYQIIGILDKILKINIIEEQPKYYRVQTGSFSVRANAVALQNKLKAAGFDSIIKNIDGLYKVQIGAYSKKVNATIMLVKVKLKGFNAFITYC
jgi:hypothetical protein